MNAIIVTTGDDLNFHAMLSSVSANFSETQCNCNIGPIPAAEHLPLPERASQDKSPLFVNLSASCKSRKLSSIHNILAIIYSWSPTWINSGRYPFRAAYCSRATFKTAPKFHFLVNYWAGTVSYWLTTADNRTGYIAGLLFDSHSRSFSVLSI